MGCAGSRSTATRVMPGAISLSSSSHFPLMPNSNVDETGRVATRPRQAFDEPSPDRIDDLHEYDRYRAGRLQ